MKAHEDAAATAAERKAQEVRERSRVIKQQQRFRDVRDENLPKGKALNAIEVIFPAFNPIEAKSEAVNKYCCQFWYQ